MVDLIKILVVEDEYVIAKSIEKYLNATGQCEVVTALNVTEAMTLLKIEQFECVLLDINLSSSRDGIWLAGYIKEKINIPYIFMTGSLDSRTISRAIETNPYGYLTKPVQKNEILPAVRIAQFKYQQIEFLKEEIATPRETEDDQAMFLKNIDKFDKVHLSEIDFIESQKNYLLIHTKSTVYRHRATIKDFIKILPQKDFIRTHRAFIANLKKIKTIDKCRNIIFVMNSKIPLSKTFKRELLDRVRLLT